MKVLHEHTFNVSTVKVCITYLCCCPLLVFVCFPTCSENFQVKCFGAYKIKKKNKTIIPYLFFVHSLFSLNLGIVLE